MYLFFKTKIIKKIITYTSYWRNVALKIQAYDCVTLDGLKYVQYISNNFKTLKLEKLDGK